MEPGPVGPSQLRQGAEVIHSASGSGPCRADDQGRPPSGGGVARNRLPESGDIELVERGAGDDPEDLPPQACNADGLVQGMMGLRGQVDRAARSGSAGALGRGLREGAGHRGQHRGEVGLAAARGEVGCRGIIAQRVGQRPQRVRLDLGRRRRVPAGAELGIVERRQGVAPDPGRVDSRDEQPEVTGMDGVERAGPEQRGSVRQRGLERDRPGERVGLQTAANLIGAGRRGDRQVTSGGVKPSHLAGHQPGGGQGLAVGPHGSATRSG